MITLSIVTPARRVAGPVEVRSVTLPGEHGQMTVLPGHAQLVGKLGTGVLVFETKDGQKEVAAVSTGFLEIKNDQVIVLAETLELAHEINLDRAQAAQSKAEARMKAKEGFEQDMLKWERKYQRALVRQLAKNYLL